MGPDRAGGRSLADPYSGLPGERQALAAGQLAGDAAERGLQLAGAGEEAALLRGRDPVQERLVSAAKADRDRLDPVLVTGLGLIDGQRLTVPDAIGQHDDEALARDVL